MEFVAQMVEHQVVVLAVAGSTPAKLTIRSVNIIG